MNKTASPTETITIRAFSLVLLFTAVLLLHGCGGGDDESDFVGPPADRVTIQPVSCAASGCAT